MTIESTHIDGLLVITPQIFTDERGYFFESYSEKKIPTPQNVRWVQDNESMSSRGVLRGLHYQSGKMAQSKLVRVILGEVYDIAVDLRHDSCTYGKWFGIILNDSNKKQVYIPRGFAHGFLALSDKAIFSYKCDNHYSKHHDAGIRYDDPTLAIQWPLPASEILLSQKDQNLPYFDDLRSP